MLEQEKESFLYWLTSKFEQNYEPRTLAKLFLVGLFGNIISWLIALFTPDSIANFIGFLADIEGKVAVYLLIIPFFFAFIMAFSVCKIIMRRKVNIDVAEGDFMNKYSNYIKQENTRLIFLIGGAVGGLNALILAFAVIAFRQN